MTNEEIDALEALAAAAAPGHWFGATPEENAPSLQYTYSARKAVPALIAALREARAELDFIKAEYADASTEDLTRDALLSRLRVQESANEGLRASVATLTADPLPAAAWVREVERAAFARGVAAMREAARTGFVDEAKKWQREGDGEMELRYLRLAGDIRAIPDPEDEP